MKKSILTLACLFLLSSYAHAGRRGRINKIVLHKKGNIFSFLDPFFPKGFGSIRENSINSAKARQLLRASQEEARNKKKRRKEKKRK